MRYLFSILVLVLFLSSCKTGDIAVQDEKEKFQIEIVFRTEEAEKRIPYKLQTLELSLKNTLPNVFRGYLATINVLPHTLSRVLEKMRADPDIISVELKDE